MLGKKMKLLSKPLMIFTMPALLVLAALGVWFITSSNAQTPGTYPADHIIRITALLEFDGKPVVVDELVTCLAEGAGTPGNQFLSFQPNRLWVITETPDGGMISFLSTRSMCYVYGDIWGDDYPELSVPESWTPVLRWFDSRDPSEWNEGIMYVSETALTAENGRLKIIENFAITIPEHPFSNALLAKAEAQATVRNYETSMSNNGFLLVMKAIGTMVEIPEEMWRHPDPKYLRTSFHANQDTDPQPLIDFLNGLGEGEGIIALPYNEDAPDQDLYISLEALRMIDEFTAGRRAGLTNLVELGVPKQNAERFGLQISENTADRFRRRPLDLDFFDTRIPWKCDNSGTVTPDFDNPGLIYLYSERCTHPRNFEQLVWPGIGVISEWKLRYGNLFYDYNSHTLWSLF